MVLNTDRLVGWLDFCSANLEQDIGAKQSVSQEQKYLQMKFIREKREIRCKKGKLSASRIKKQQGDDFQQEVQRDWVKER